MMFRPALACLAFLAALVAAPAGAQQAPREAAYAALKSADPVERGRGVVLLAREGRMTDAKRAKSTPSSCRWRSDRPSTL